MKKIILTTFLSIVLSLVGVNAQLSNTLYFLESAPVRHQFNPAFQPLCNFYISLPAIGNSQVSLGNNSLTVSMLDYDKTKLLNTIKPSTLIDADIQTNLLGFGFRKGSAYWTFAATAKMAADIAIPNDVFRLLLNGNAEIINGVPTLTNSTFDLSDSHGAANGYIEAALGYSRELSEKWTVGVKLKYLHGFAGAKLYSSNLTLLSGIDDFTLKGNATLSASYPDIDNISVKTFLKPAGIGGAIDLGATYKPIENLQLAASVTDLGMMRWNSNINNSIYSIDYQFYGLNGFNINNILTILTGVDTGNLTDSILTDLKDHLQETTNNKGFGSTIAPRMNASAEYSFLNEILSVGVLGSAKLLNKKIYPSVTAAVNVRPANWFNMSLSYSVLNGKGGNLGAGLGFRLGFVNAFVTADYIPMYYANLSSPLSLGGFNITKVPAKTDRLNLAVGVNLTFGNKQDDDKDGVKNRKDKCPDTPFGVIVTKDGCPLDTDGDGVPDYLDKCPDTPKEAKGFVDPDGCPLDTDGDGVPDFKDKCPDTPEIAWPTVDSIGCPKDTDLDKVPDYQDKCPDTPEAERNRVDSVGCTIPLDSVALGLKKPGTSTIGNASANSNISGDNLDSDGDGIPDKIDRCPHVAGVKSNGGCPEIKKEVKVIFQKALLGIQFETAKYDIKPLSFVILDHVVRVLLENPNYMVEVQGHTDNMGDAAKNQVLSENRANAVKNYLIEKGVPASQLSSNGYGPTRPVAPNTTAEGRKQNRRVEFVVSFE